MAWEKVINAMPPTEIERRPTARDLGRRLNLVSKPDGSIITGTMIAVAIMYTNSDHNGGNIIEKVYGAKEFQALLDSMSKKPSDHIKAWFEATLSEQKTIADTEVSGSDEFQTEAMAADIKPIIKDTDSFARKQVERIFNKINKEQWRGIFSREKNQNGIGIARTGPKGHPLYDLEKVSNWLKTYITPRRILKRLFRRIKNLFWAFK